MDLARSVNNTAEEQRALATIGRTYLFLHDTDQSRESLRQAKDAFKKSLAILDGRLEGWHTLVDLLEVKTMGIRLVVYQWRICPFCKLALTHSFSHSF